MNHIIDIFLGIRCVQRYCFFCLMQSGDERFDHWQETMKYKVSEGVVDI